MRLLPPEKSWAPPEGQRKTDEPFRSANFSDVMLFRRCAARCLRRKMSVLQSATSLAQSVEAVGCFPGNSAATGELGRLSRGGLPCCTVHAWTIKDACGLLDDADATQASVYLSEKCRKTAADADRI